MEWGVLLSPGESMWLTELELKYDHRPEVLLRGARAGTRSPTTGSTWGSSRRKRRANVRMATTETEGRSGRHQARPRPVSDPPGPARPGPAPARGPVPLAGRSSVVSGPGSAPAIGRRPIMTRPGLWRVARGEPAAGRGDRHHPRDRRRIQPRYDGVGGQIVSNVSGVHRPGRGFDRLDRDARRPSPPGPLRRRGSNRRGRPAIISAQALPSYPAAREPPGITRPPAGPGPASRGWTVAGGGRRVSVATPADLDGRDLACDESLYPASPQSNPPVPRLRPLPKLTVERLVLLKISRRLLF